MPKFKLTILQHKIVGHPYIPICKFQINDIKQNQTISTDWINPPLYKSDQLPEKARKKQIFPINVLLNCQQNAQFLINLYQLTSNGRQVKIGHTKLTISESLINKKTKHRILKGVEKNLNKNNLETVSIMEIVIIRSEFRSKSKDNTQILGSGRLNQSKLYQSPLEENSSQNSQRADSNQNYFQTTDQKNYNEESLQNRISNIKANLVNKNSRQKYEESQFDISNYRNLIKNVDNQDSKESPLLTESVISGYKKRRTGYKFHSMKRQANSALDFPSKNKQQSQQIQNNLNKKIKYFKHFKNANLIKNIHLFILGQNQHEKTLISKKKNYVESQSLTFLTYEFYQTIVKVLPSKNEVEIFFQQYSEAQIKLPSSNFVIRIQLMLESQQVYSGTIGNQQGTQMKAILKLQTKNKGLQSQKNIRMVFDIQKYVQLVKNNKKQSITKEEKTKIQSQKWQSSSRKLQNQVQSQIRKRSFGPKQKNLQQQKVPLIQPWRFSQFSPYKGQTLQNATAELKRKLRASSQLNSYQNQQINLPRIEKIKHLKFNKKSRNKMLARRKLVNQSQQKVSKQKLRNFDFSRDRSLEKSFKTDSQDSNYYKCSKKLQRTKIQTSDLVQKAQLKYNKSKKKLKKQTQLDQNIRRSLQKYHRSHTQNQIEALQNESPVRKTLSKRFIQQLKRNNKKKQSKSIQSAIIQKNRKKQNQNKKVLTLDIIQNLSLSTKLTLQIYSIKLLKQTQSFPAFPQNSGRELSKQQQKQQKYKQKQIFFKIYIQGKKSHLLVTSSSKKRKNNISRKIQKKLYSKKVLEESFYQWYFDQNQILFDKISKEDFLIIQAFYDLNANDYQENIGKCIISINQFMYLVLKNQINGYLVHKNKVAGQLFLQFNLSLYNSEDSNRQNNLNRWQY